MGPAGMLYSWVTVWIGSMAVAAFMAEIMSACPMIGGLYYFSGRLAPLKLKAIAGFLTAHFNVIAASSNISNATKFGLYAAVILLITILCTATSRVTAWYSTFGAVWSLIALGSFTAAVFAAAPAHKPLSYVFTEYEINSDVTGITSSLWSFMVGTGMGLSTIIMYDSGIYMSKEAVDATRSVPSGLIWAVAAMGPIGVLSIAAFSVAVQDSRALLDPHAKFLGTDVAAQLIHDVMYARFQSDGAAIPFLAIAAVGQFLSVLHLVMGLSRKVYAMSRDKLILGSSIFSRVDTRLLIPYNALLLVASGQLCLGLGLLDSTGLFYTTLTSGAQLAVYTSYLIPVTLALTTSEVVHPGPWQLGPRLGKLVRVTAAAYLVLALLCSAMPPGLPVVAPTSLPYAPLTFGVLIVVLVACWWAPVVGGRASYSGPVAVASGGPLVFAVTAPILKPTRLPLPRVGSARGPSGSDNSGSGRGTRGRPPPRPAGGWAAVPCVTRAVGSVREACRQPPTSLFVQHPCKQAAADLIPVVRTPWRALALLTKSSSGPSRASDRRSPRSLALSPSRIPAENEAARSAQKFSRRNPGSVEKPGWSPNQLSRPSSRSARGHSPGHSQAKALYNAGTPVRWNFDELSKKVQGRLTVGSLTEWAITSDHAPLDATLAVAAWEDAATPAAAVPRQGRPRACFAVAEWTRYAHQVGEQRVADLLDANTADLLAGSISSSEAAATLSSTLRQCLALAFPVRPTALSPGADHWDQSCHDAREQLRTVLRAPHRHSPGAAKAARKVYYQFVKGKRQAFSQRRLQQQTTAYFNDSKSFFRSIQPTTRVSHPKD
ncbi:MAG: hypothetical protein WDW38_007991 [Sanguina aurantia]